MLLLLLILLELLDISLIGGDREGVVIKVDTTSIIGRVSPLIFGVNHRYHDNGTGSWDAEKYLPVEEVVENLVSSGVTMLRFPGGTVGTTYHWLDGVGPVDNRPYSISGFTGEPIPNVYGFDEHMLLVESINATTTIVVNFGSGTSLEAAAWVAYANGDTMDNRSLGVDVMGRDWGTISYWAKLREENQRRLGVKTHRYNITYWEIGNEIYGNWEYSWTHNVTRYAFGGRERFVNQTVGKHRDWREIASKSNGTPNQVFYIKYPPIIPGTQEVFVDGERWRRIEDLTLADSDDKVYELNYRNGRIRFGDGVHGRIPPSGVEIRVNYECEREGFIDFYNAMKYVDSDIKIGSCFSNLEFIEIMGDRHPCDFLIIHDYYRLKSDRDIEKLYYEAITSPLLLNLKLDHLHRYIERYAKNRVSNIEFAVTEYNIIPPIIDPTPSFGQSLTRAIYVAGMLKVFIENNVTVANIHCLISPTPSRGVWRNSPILYPPPYYTRMAASYSLELFSKHLQPNLVSIIVDGSPTYNVTYRDEKYSVPYLEALATVNEYKDKLSLLVINKHHNESIEARFEINGLSSLSSSATMYTLTAEDITTYNDPHIIEKPKRNHLYILNRDITSLPGETLVIGGINIEVNPEKTHRVDIKENIYNGIKEEFTYGFPPHSITIIEIPGVETIREDNDYIVEFYIDDESRCIDYDAPYEWLWDEPVIGKHGIKTIAHSREETISDEMRVTIINLINH